MRSLIILAIAATATLAACNEGGPTNSNNTQTQGSVPDHTDAGPHANAGSTGTVRDSASMMDLMHGNMQGMKAIPSSGNPDRDFAALMKVHHQGAVEMARVEVAKGSDATIKQMAQGMLGAQQEEIAAMDRILAGLPQKGSNETFYRASMQQMDAMQMNMDHSGSLDQQFVEMMIPHHQGAIDMSNQYPKNGASNAELKAMAQKIIADQKKEIAAMQAWLKKN